VLNYRPLDRRHQLPTPVDQASIESSRSQVDVIDAAADPITIRGAAAVN